MIRCPLHRADCGDPHCVTHGTPPSPPFGKNFTISIDDGDGNFVPIVPLVSYAVPRRHDPIDGPPDEFTAFNRRWLERNT